MSVHVGRRGGPAEDVVNWVDEREKDLLSKACLSVGILLDRGLYKLTISMKDTFILGFCFIYKD